MARISKMMRSFSKGHRKPLASFPSNKMPVYFDTHLIPYLNYDFVSMVNGWDQSLEFVRVVADGLPPTASYIGSDGLIKYARKNLIKYSEDLTQSLWNKTGSVAVDYKTVTFSGTGSTTNYINQVVAAFAASSDISITFKLKCAVAGILKVRLYNGVDQAIDTSIDIDGSNIYRKYEINLTLNATTPVNPYLRFWSFDANLVNIDIGITEIQVEVGSSASNYIKTTDQYSGAPRFEYDPLTHAPIGLLIEGNRTNNFPYSDDFTTWSTTWSADGARTVITANNAIAPDGTMTADKIGGDGSATSYVYRSVSWTSGQYYAISCFAKDAGGQNFSIQSFTQVGFVRFNLSAKTVYQLSGTGVDGYLEEFQNGWFRCTAIFLASDTASNNIGFDMLALNGDHFWIWGAQHENSALKHESTSLICTTSSALTRNADKCYRNLPVPITAGSFCVEFNLRDSKSGNIAIVTLDNGSPSNAVSLRTAGSYSNALKPFVNNAGSNYFGSPALPSPIPYLGNIKGGFSYSTAYDRYRLNYDGNNSTEITSAGEVPVVPLTRLIIGSDNYFSSTSFNRNIRSFKLFNKELLNLDLMEITK